MLEWLDQAADSDPDGVVCHFCEKPNDFVDDCGFFYIIDPREPETRDDQGFLRNKIYPVCQPCYNQHSWRHIELYGLGDR